MKRFSLLLAILLICLWPVPKPARAGTNVVSVKFSAITSGTPQQVWTQGPLIADEVIIQPLASSTNGIVYVYKGIYNHTPSTSTDTPVQLCAATSTAPGCPYSDGTTVTTSTGIDVAALWVDVATTNTPVLVSFQPR